MALKPELLHALFERASQEELGLVVETNNPKQLQITLDTYRKSNNLDEFRNLIVAVPSKENMIILVKKTVDLDGG